MDSRRTSETVARNVRSAITTAGLTPESVASATDLDISELNARLDGREEFSIPELVAVGGFLHVRPESLLEGVAA